jgi:hypothetical protein
VTVERQNKTMIYATISGDSPDQVHEEMQEYLGKYPRWRFFSRVVKGPVPMGFRSMYYGRIRRRIEPDLTIPDPSPPAATIPVAV